MSSGEWVDEHGEEDEEIEFIDLPSEDSDLGDILLQQLLMPSSLLLELPLLLLYSSSITDEPDELPVVTGFKEMTAASSVLVVTPEEEIAEAFVIVDSHSSPAVSSSSSSISNSLIHSSTYLFRPLMKNFRNEAYLS